TLQRSIPHFNQFLRGNYAHAMRQEVRLAPAKQRAPSWAPLGKLRIKSNTMLFQIQSPVQLETASSLPGNPPPAAGYLQRAGSFSAASPCWRPLPTAPLRTIAGRSV